MPHQISAPIKRFLDGFRRFQTNYYHPDNFRFEDLQHGQQPSTMVIGCADSRVDPAMLMGCEPGELFVVRNIANLVPPCEDHAHETHHSVSAALEYAVTSLEVERIIVLGHGCCGGIRALMDGITRQPEGGYLAKWLSIAEPVCDHVHQHYAVCDDATQRAIAERQSILISLDNLLTYPWIQQRFAAGSLELHGWYFDIRDGALHGCNLHTRQFMPLVCPLEHRDIEAGTA
ncbi:MAG: carbonic anhydrase [Laribacter sp.]|nr:carbonic anhydrase [Laribacter sp.]MBP9527980.1 carbonic anhydrase [Laribacter sp.]MBP9609068.1 carbonic anhydrase [Laribacter sp.]